MDIRTMDREEFIATYEVCTAKGLYYSPQQLWAYCMKAVRRSLLDDLSLAERQVIVARYLNDPKWLRPYKGCVPNCIARDLVKDATGAHFADKS